MSDLIKRIEEAAEQGDLNTYNRLMKEYENPREPEPEQGVLGKVGSALKETLIDESLFPAVNAVGSAFDKGVEYLPRPASNFIKGFQRGLGDNVEGIAQGIYQNNPEALMNVYNYRKEALTEYQKNVDSDNRIPFSGIGRFGGNIAPYMINPKSLLVSMAAGGISGFALPTDNYDNLSDDKLVNTLIGAGSAGVLNKAGPLIERSFDSAKSGLQKTVQSVQDVTQARARLANTVESLSDYVPLLGKKSDTSMRKARKAIKDEFLSDELIHELVPRSKFLMDIPEVVRGPQSQNTIKVVGRKIADTIKGKQPSEKDLIREEILRDYIKKNPEEVLNIQKNILVNRGARTGNESMKDLGSDVVKDLTKDIPSMLLSGAPIKTASGVVDKVLSMKPGVEKARIEQKLINNMEDFLFPSSRALGDVLERGGLQDLATEAVINPSSMLKYPRFLGDAADMGLGSGRFSQIIGPTNTVERDEEGNIMFRQLFGD